MTTTVGTKAPERTHVFSEHLGRFWLVFFGALVCAGLAGWAFGPEEGFIRGLTTFGLSLLLAFLGRITLLVHQSKNSAWYDAQGTLINDAKWDIYHWRYGALTRRHYKTLNYGRYARKFTSREFALSFANGSVVPLDFVFEWELDKTLEGFTRFCKQSGYKGFHHPDASDIRELPLGSLFSGRETTRMDTARFEELFKSVVNLPLERSREVLVQLTPELRRLFESTESIAPESKAQQQAVEALVKKKFAREAFDNGLVVSCRFRFS
jgi:hypothetical protein